MSEYTVNAPFTGRWAPVPVQGLLELMKDKLYHAAVIWMIMLADAQQHPLWRTSRSVRAMHEETQMALNTIKKAQRKLIEVGYISIVAGGRGTRKKITFSMTRIAKFNGKSGQTGQDGTPQKKPVGNWSLGVSERERGDWES